MLLWSGSGQVASSRRLIERGASRRSARFVASLQTLRPARARSALPCPTETRYPRGVSPRPSSRLTVDGARPSRRNSALRWYVNGKRARNLDGLQTAAGGVLSAYDTAVSRAVVGLKRRTLPAVSRAVRANYNVKARSLAGRVRAEMGTAGGARERSDFLSIWASTRQISLLDFGGRWGGRKSEGATAAITRGGVKTYRSAFIATVKGLRAIRVRSFVSTGRRAGRGPLRILRGPSPFEMLSGLDRAPSVATRRSVLAELTDFYTSELRRQFRLNAN